MTFSAKTDLFISRVVRNFIPVISIYSCKNKIEVTESIGFASKYKVIHSRTYTGEDELFSSFSTDFAAKDKLIIVNSLNTVAVYKLFHLYDVEDDEIEAYFEDQYYKLFKIPSPTPGFTVVYQILKKETDSFYILACLYNNKIVESLIDTYKEAGIYLTGVVHHHSFLINEESELRINYISTSISDEIVFTESNKILSYFQINTQKQVPDVSTISKFITTHLSPDQVQLLSSITSSSLSDLSPTNIDTSVASPEILKKLSTFELLPFSQKINLSTNASKKYKELIILKWMVRKIAFFFSLIYLSLLLIGYAFIEVKSSFLYSVQAEASMIEPSLSKMDSLKNKLDKLARYEKDLKNLKSNRTISYFLLEGLAQYKADNLWYISIDYSSSEKDNNVVIKGFSDSQNKIYELLSILENDSNFSNVKLLFLRKVQAKKLLKDWGINSSRYIEFSIGLIY